MHQRHHNLQCDSSISTVNYNLFASQKWRLRPHGGHVADKSNSSSPLALISRSNSLSLANGNPTEKKPRILVEPTRAASISEEEKRKQRMRKKRKQLKKELRSYKKALNEVGWPCLRSDGGDWRFNRSGRCFLDVWRAIIARLNPFLSTAASDLFVVTRCARVLGANLDGNYVRSRPAKSLPGLTKSIVSIGCVRRVDADRWTNFAHRFMYGRRIIRLWWHSCYRRKQLVLFACFWNSFQTACPRVFPMLMRCARASCRSAKVH